MFVKHIAVVFRVRNSLSIAYGAVIRCYALILKTKYIDESELPNRQQLFSAVRFESIYKFFHIIQNKLQLIKEIAFVSLKE